MTLVEANKGDTVKVVNVPTGVLRARMIRLGISEGSEVTCVLKIPAGPVVVRQGNLEVALGKKIASGIEVSR